MSNGHRLTLITAGGGPRRLRSSSRIKLRREVLPAPASPSRASVGLLSAETRSVHRRAMFMRANLSSLAARIGSSDSSHSKSALNFESAVISGAELRWNGSGAVKEALLAPTRSRQSETASRAMSASPPPTIRNIKFRSAKDGGDHHASFKRPFGDRRTCSRRATAPRRPGTQVGGYSGRCSIPSQAHTRPLEKRHAATRARSPSGNKTTDGCRSKARPGRKRTVNRPTA